MTIRIQARNNSDCRRFGALDGIRSARVRHNGGRLMIATVAADDIAEAVVALDESAQVATYEVL